MLLIDGKLLYHGRSISMNPVDGYRAVGPFLELMLELVNEFLITAQGDQVIIVISRLR